jgi:hypothetical protein
MEADVPDGLGVVGVLLDASEAADGPAGKDVVSSANRFYGA